MNKKPLLIVIIVLAFVSLACSININLPATDVKTGPTQTDELSVPVPDANQTIDLKFSFGAGEFKLEPATQSVLVSGTASYNVEDFKPIIETSANLVEIKQGNLELKGIPDFRKNIKNEWDLKINQDTPLNLKISAGAYSGRYEFGGLSLENLEVTDGASTVDLNFSKPNQGEMTTFRYNTGASTVTMTGLGNANFSTMVFKGGAGSYKLGFDGELKQDAVVSIDSGISTVTIVVPEGVSAQVTFEGGLTNVQTFGQWTKSGDSYTLEGSGPELTFVVKMGAGTLELRNK